MQSMTKRTLITNTIESLFSKLSDIVYICLQPVLWETAHGNVNAFEFPQGLWVYAFLVSYSKVMSGGILSHQKEKKCSI